MAGRSMHVYRLSTLCETTVLSNITKFLAHTGIQNVLKILNIPFKSVLTEGIKGTYNWKRICKGCKKEYHDNYEEKICEVCGSEIIKKRIKLN